MTIDVFNVGAALYQCLDNVYVVPGEGWSSRRVHNMVKCCASTLFFKVGGLRPGSAEFQPVPCLPGVQVPQ